MSAFLKRTGVLDDATEEQIRAEAKEAMAESVREMEAIEHPGQEILFEHTYASGQPWTFREGLEELRQVERPAEVKPMGPQPGSSTGDLETKDAR